MNQSLFDFVVFGKNPKPKSSFSFGFFKNFSKLKPYQTPLQRTIDNVNPDSSALENENTFSQNKTAQDATQKSFLPFVVLFSSIVLVSAVIFIFRSFDLQVFKSSEYNLLSQRNRTRTYEIPAPRGVIYDRNNKIIAQNKPSFNLVLNIPLCALGKDLSLCRKIVEEVDSQISLSNKAELLELLQKNPSNSLVLSKDLNKDQIIAIESKNLPALNVLTYPSREYLYPAEFAHLIGYTGLSSTSISPVIEGKTGIESQYDSVLKGLPGKRVVQVNSQNKDIQEFDTQDPVPGKNITLFADIGLQRLAYEILREIVDGIPVSLFDTDEVTKSSEYIEGLSKSKGGSCCCSRPKNWWNFGPS